MIDINKTYYDLPDKIDLLMAGDINVFEGICLTALSAVKKTELPIRLHLITTFSMNTKGLKKEQAELLESKLKTISPESEVHYIDATGDYEEWFRNSPNKKPPYSTCSLLRLFAPKYINSARLIYLDADTMCVSGLEEFFTNDISNIEMAVVKDYMGRFWIKRDYFNSGVLFINMDKCKETDLFNQTNILLTRKKYYMADQSALYHTSKYRLYLPFRYNEQRSIKEDTVIKHFNKGIKYFPFFHIYNYKQWQRDKVHKKLKIFDFDYIYEIYDELFKK